MSDVCLRNMSCKCSLCAGEDTAMLLSITRSIASAVAYDDTGEGDDGAAGSGDNPSPPPAPLGRMTNSPPLPAARKGLANSPPPPQRAAAAANPPPAAAAAAPAARKSALPSRGVRKSALPARPPIKRVEQPAVDDGGDDVVMEDIALPPPPVVNAEAPPPPAPIVATAPPPMPVASTAPVASAAVSGDKCQRTMSCKCPLCAGEDTAMLLSISRSIASSVAYENGDGDDDGDTPMPPPAPLGRMTNSPPIPAARKRVANSPPPPAQRKAALALPPVAAATAAAVAPTVPASGESSAGAASVAATAVVSGVSDLSVEDVVARLMDKNWKLRKEGCEHVKAHCERPGARHDDVEPFLEFFSKMVDDANASAMEAGVQAVLAYALHVEPFQKSVVPGVMKKLTDKGFSSRPGVVKSCEEIVTAFIEAGAVEDTVAALIEGTKNKKPKVPPACCANLLDALKAFGPRVVPLPAVKAALPALCESTVNGVRPIALAIVAEVHRWTGPALVQDIVANLRQAQKTEYETLTKDVVVGQAAPTRFVRGAARPAAATQRSSGASSWSAAGASAASAFDPREFAETVDLLAKLPKTEFKAKLALPKWSEKVEALKIVLDLIGPVPKLASGDYYELVSTLKLLSTDANVNIVAKSIEVLGALADGLRKQFTLFARTLFPELVRKLSDKKAVILNATNTALDLFLQHALTVDMILDELKASLDAAKNKAPQARVQVLGFVTRAVEQKLVNVADKSLMLEFGGLFAAAMEDTDPTVRKAGVDAFTAMLNASAQIAAWLQSMLDDVARKNPRAHKTILQSVGTGSAAKTGPAGAKPAAPPATAAAAAGKKPAADAMDVDSAGPPPAVAAAAARLGVKKPAAARGPPSRLAAAAGGAAAEAPTKPAATRKPGAGATGGGGAAAGGDFTPMAISVAPEETEDVLVELGIDGWGEIKDGFASAKWTDRKAAIEQLEGFARDNSAALTMRTIEALTVFLSKQVKDFKDSNVNVLKSAFQAVGTFAECCASKFPRGVVCQLVPSAAEKISDRKAAEAIRAMLLQFCEVVGPSYVVGCLVSCMPAVKAPLAHIEVLVVLADCVKDFGVAVCSPRSLIEFAKGAQGLESTNPKVRTSAIALLAAMYAQLGPALLPILALDSWKPALAALVEAEFKKTGFDPSSALASVKRQVKGSDDSGAAKPLDAGALFGRVDISSQLTKELFADMKCEEDMAAWKKRAAAMDAVQSICDGAGGAIEFTKSVQEALKALKARLNDSNANLKVKAAQVIGVVAASVGPEISKMSKFLGASLVSGVADNKKTMQTAAVEALHKWVRHSNQTSQACVESLLSAVSEGLLNPVGRAELLGWAAEHLKSCDKLDLNSLVVPTVQCLMDKSSEAREKAQLVLAEVVRSVGQETVLTAGCRDIKPAQMRTLRPLIQKVCESISDVPAAAAAAAGPTAAPAATVATAAAPAVPDTPTRTGIGASRLAKAGSVPLKAGVAGRSALVRPGSFRPGAGADGGDAAVPEGSEDGDATAPSTALLKMNTSKSARLARGQSNKWLFESTSASEMSSRKAEVEAEWKPFLSPELHAKLFAPTLEKGMLAAITDLMACAASQPRELLAALDLVLKWCSLRLVDNNVQALAKLLDFLVKLFEVLKSLAYQLDDVEAAIFLPYLLQESGQSKPRFRVRFRDIMKLVADVYSREKYTAFVLECLSACKNMKSRCECIDLVEYMVAAFGFHGLGKKCVKEVGKYATAHEKELRESALNALVAVYTRTDGNLDKFFRFTGVTSQQGMDLLNARIKHLPPGSMQDGGAALQPGLPAPVLPPPPPPQHQQASFGFSAAVPMSPAAYQPLRPLSTPPPRMPAAVPTMKPPSNGVAALGQPQDDDDEDADMTGLSLQDEPEVDDDDDGDHASQDSVEALLLRPIDGLLTDTKDIVDDRSPLYAVGIDALKGLYAIIERPSGESELAFLRYYVNDIFIKLCDLIHGSLRPAEPKTPPLSTPVLSLSLSILSRLVASEASDSIQRYAVERVVLEICSTMLDPRIEEFAARGSTASLNLASLSPERRRLLLLYKALVKALRGVLGHVKAGELFPSVINLLQRIVRNDVGDYNTRDAFNHLMNADSLDQLVGRLLVQISHVQANAMHPFDGVDIFGVLMQMHSFFSTLPHTDLFAVQIANDNMHSALRIIAESLLATRGSSFEASLSDLPTPSPVRELLTSMALSGAPQQQQQQQQLAAAGAAPRTSNGSVSAAAPPASNGSGADPVTRRLFDGGATAASSARASFTSFNEFAASRASASAAARSSVIGAPGERVNGNGGAAASASQLLRERLERVRQF